MLGIFRKQMNHPSSLLNSKTTELLGSWWEFTQHKHSPCHSDSKPSTRTWHEIKDPCMAECTSAAQHYPPWDWTEQCSATEHTTARFHKVFTWATASYQDYPRIPLHNVTENSTSLSLTEGQLWEHGCWWLTRRHLLQLSSTATQKFSIEEMYSHRGESFSY